MDDLPSDIRRSCLRCSYRLCDREGLLPKSLLIPLCYNPAETPRRYGGFADVWKGEHKDQVVAAKVFRAHGTDDREQLRKVGGV